MSPKIVMFFILAFLACFLYAQQDATPEKVREKIIYIPYTQLEKLIQKDDAGIYLPYQDYRKLMEELEKLRQKPPELPTMAVISNVSYQGKVSGEFLQVEASCTLNVFKEGWHGVELGFKNIALKEASLDNEPALLKLKGESYELVFKSDKAEKKALKMVFVVPIQRTHTLRATADFNIPRAPIANLTLEIPNTGEQSADSPRMKVDVEPSILTQVQVVGQITQVRALLGNTDSVHIVWESQAERKVEIKNIIHAENITHLDVGENFLQMRCRVLYDLIQGNVNQLKLRIPKEFRVFSINSIQGTGIQDWNLEEEETLVVINLHEKMNDLGEGKTDLELEVKLEKVIKKMEPKFSLPVIEVLGVEREKGFYTIAVDDLHTLQIIKRKDITQIDIKELPDNVSKTDAHFAFKYLKKPFVLDLELEKKKPEYEVTSSIYSYMDDTLLYKIHAFFQYDIKKSRIFGTRIEVPANSIRTIVHAYDMSTPVRGDRYPDCVKEHREVTEKDKRFLDITFQNGIGTPNLFVYVYMEQKFPEGEKMPELTLPVFQVDEAKHEAGNIGIGVKSNFSITTVDKSQKNVFPLDTTQLFKNLPDFLRKKVPEIVNLSEQVKNTNIGLQYTGHPIGAQFKIEKRDPLVTAEVYDYVDVAENVLKHQFQIFYDVKYTGVKEFSFILPKFYPDGKTEISKFVTKSHITDKNSLIKETSIADFAKDTKQTLYTVSTQREILGSYTIYVAYEEKMAQVETIKDISIFELTTQKTEREHGFIVFKKNNNFAMEFDGKGLETTDINDPTFSKGEKEGVLAIFKYNTHGYNLVMRLQKLSFEPVLNTVINRLHITTTVNKDFTTKNDAVILLLNNRKQMLEFEVPEESEITYIGVLANTYLFSMDSSCEYALNSRNVNAIIGYFQTNRQPLSYYNTRITCKKLGQKWILEDQDNASTYCVIKDSEKNTFDVHRTSYPRGMVVSELDKCFKPLTWSKSDAPRRFKVNIATNVEKDAPFVLIIKYNSTIGKGEMKFSGDFTVRSIDFVDVPVTYFTWDLGLPTEYYYVWFQSNLSKRYSYEYGTWNVLYPLLSSGSVDTTDIKQESETGVIPIYPLEGKHFAFAMLNGKGYVTVSYLYPTWLSTLNFLLFLVACIIIAFLPKTGVVNRLTTFFCLMAFSIFMACLNLQGYQDIWFSLLMGTIIAGSAAGLIRFCNVVASWTPSAQKPHQIFREPGKDAKDVKDAKTPADANKDAKHAEPAKDMKKEEKKE